MTFTVVGSQLKVDINNTSAFEIAQLYFNSDVTFTGLAFNAAGATNAAWSIAGPGASQTQAANGFGLFNWLVDFGATTRLAAGSTTNLALDMTGTTTEAGIAGKSSVNPPGDENGIGAINESGPGGDSAYGGAISGFGGECGGGGANSRRKNFRGLQEEDSALIFNTGDTGLCWRLPR